jgi:hypothetical protein
LHSRRWLTIASACTPLSVRPALCSVARSPVTSNTARSTDCCTEGPWPWRCRPMKGAVELEGEGKRVMRPLP